MVQRTRAQRLNGLFPLSYMGVIPTSPANFIIDQRPPTINDDNNVYIGDIWLDTSTDTPPKIKDVYILVSLAAGIATWLPFGGGNGTVITLTGNTGGPVGPTLGNINVLGDGITCTIAGNPGTSTLTVSVIGGTGVVETLTGDTGGAVGPTLNNINILGTPGVLAVIGNPGTSTLTLQTSGHIPTMFTENTGVAVPSGGNLNVLGASGITTSGAGSTITISPGGSIATSYVEDSGTAVPSGGVLNIIGGTGISTSGAGNTVTITNTGNNPAASDSFFAYLSTGQTNATGDGFDFQVVFDTVIYNNGGNYNNGTGVWTAPATGSYVFTVGINFGNLGAGNNGGSQFITSNATCTIMRLNDLTSANTGTPFFAVATSATMTIPLNIGETVLLQAEVSGGARTVSVRGGSGLSMLTWFSGYRLF